MRECGVATEPHADTIRITLPGDADLAPVVAVAVRVAGRRLGLPEDDVNHARTDAAAAFTELTTGAGAPVEVQLVLEPESLSAVLRSGDEQRTVEAPRR